MTVWTGTQLFFLALVAALVARLTVSFWPSFGKADAKTHAKDATNAAPILLWHEAPDGRVTWANAPYLALTQATQGVDGLARLFGPDTSGKQRRTVEVDGEFRWFDVDHSPVTYGRIGHATPVDTVVRLEQALGEMLQTMAKTFAHLPTGLAVFDRDRHLQLFNPALCDLTGLSPAFMSRRPSLNAFLDAMRDRKTVPEPADWKAWRRRLTDMDRHRADLELGQAVIDSLDDAIAVFSGSGHLVMSNAAYAAFWGHDPAGLVGDIGIRHLADQWRSASAPTPVWAQAEEFVTLIEDRAPWQAEVRLADGRLIGCRVTPLSGGATMMAFHRAVPEPMPHAVSVAKRRRNG